MSCASCTEPAASSAKPVVRAVITSEWSPKIDSAEVASERAATWNTVEVSSPAILNMLGSISIRPCEAVKVVVSAPDCSAPCTAPAAPPSLCISCTTGTLPQMFGDACGRPLVGQLGHRRGRRDREDRADLVDAVGDVGDGGVAVHRAFAYSSCSCLPPCTFGPTRARGPSRWHGRDTARSRPRSRCSGVVDRDSAGRDRASRSRPRDRRRSSCRIRSSCRRTGSAAPRAAPPARSGRRRPRRSRRRAAPAAVRLRATIARRCRSAG